MSLNVRHPVWLPAVPGTGVRVFALLFFIETFARASMATVIPIQAYALLQDEQGVSFLYTASAAVSLCFGLAIPILIRRLSRRWVYTLGAVLLATAGGLIATGTVPGQLAGMIGRVMGTACLNVTLSLYILDHIAKRDYVKNDSTRLFFSTLGWTVAPFFGVWLYTNWGPWAPAGFSAAWAVILVAVFWYLRLTERGIKRAKIAPINPLRQVRRFASQRRLRLAWTIAFGRSCFWTTFFVYGPILMLVAGEGEQAGGLLISAGNLALVMTIFWGRVSGRFGVRRLTAFSFLATGLAMAGAAILAGPSPFAGAVFLWFAAVFVVPLDSVGGVAFYRAVHPHERAEMTAVYRSYIDASELLPQIIYGILLAYFGLGAVFLALAILLGACALLTWHYLPRRL